MEVDHPERAIAKVKIGDEPEPVYKSVTGVQLPKNRDKKSESELDSEDTTSSTAEDNVAESEKSVFKNSHRPRDESADSKRERKKAIKAEKAEKRKTKVKKSIKKRKEKSTSKK